MKVLYTTTVGDIAARSCGSLIAGSADTVIKTISTDSRELGDDNLFVPIAGEKFDGHNFIESLCSEKKLTAFLTQNPEHQEIARKNSISAILCENTLAALGSIAASHRSQFTIPVIGITGTNGKTTTKELLWSVFSQNAPCHKNKKNYNNEIGVPFTLLELNSQHRRAVIEMGMNHRGEIHRLSCMTGPDAAVITNAGEGHLEFLETVENVALAKSEILHGMKSGSLIFLNRDSAYFDLMERQAVNYGVRVRTFGLSDTADMFPVNMRAFSDRLELTLDNDVFSAPLYGVHNAVNMLAAIAVAREYGIKSGEIKAGLSAFVNVDMRSQIIEHDGYFIINDAYNSNPLSSHFALRSVNQIYPAQRKIAILSDMKELGDTAEQLHRAAGTDVAENRFDYLFTFGDDARFIAEGALAAGMEKMRVNHFTTKDTMIQSVKEILREGDVVLVKGSRSMKMEEVADGLVRA